MSLLSISRWRPAHLFASWIVYWVALAAVALGPVALPIFRATRDNAKGEISANVADGVLSLIVKESGVTTWSGSVHLLTATLWLAVPPLILWLVWAATRRAPAQAPVGAGR